ncbi:polysaccharide biosynthesis protein HfsE [soil metagenome]
MPDIQTARRPDLPLDATPLGAPSTEGPTFDARGLQALAGAALPLDEPEAPVGLEGAVGREGPVGLEVAAPLQGAARRGPFRPEVWLNTRQKHASRQAVHYFRAIDVLLLTALTLAIAWMASPGSVFGLSVAQGLPFGIGALTLLGLLRSLGLYRFARGERTGRHLASVSGVVAAAALAALLVAVLLGATSGELVSIGGWAVASLALMAALHLIWDGRVARWRANGALTPNIVVVGATKTAERLIQDALKRRDLNVLGVFDDRLARSPDSVSGVPVLGGANALLTHKMTPYVDRIVLAIDPNAQARVRELMVRLGTLPNEVSLLVDTIDEDQRFAALEKLAQAPLADLNGPADADRRAFNKRIQDLVVGTVAFVLLAPVIGVCALMVKLDSPGPIFFRQRRHGFNQEEIVVWKFRSMRHEAADATASRQVTADDDRVTRVGKILRSTSLDELPQLINVLTGEMSLVGPRPHAIGMKTGEVESALLVAEYAHRHRIKPGMTGWAAIHGSRGPLHNEQDVRRRVQLDIDYVERHSVWLDLWIMAVTVPVLLGDRAAVR